jgi:hypothetical protein
MKNGVKVVNEDGEVVAVFYSVRRKGDRLVIDGKALDVMRMDMILTPREIFKLARMTLCWGVISFILLLPYFGLKRIASRFSGGPQD